MNYRIETKEAFRVVGISDALLPKMELNSGSEPKIWENAAMSTLIPKLVSMMEGDPIGLLGVSSCKETNQRYYIAVTSNQPTDPILEEYIVPASTWVVFSGKENNQSIQELEKRMITEWLPTSDYEFAESSDVESYLSVDPQNSKFEVWIPVQKKINKLE